MEDNVVVIVFISTSGGGREKNHCQNILRKLNDYYVKRVTSLGKRRDLQISWLFLLGEHQVSGAHFNGCSLQSCTSYDVSIFYIPF